MTVLVPLPRPKEAAGAHLPTLLQGNPPSRVLRSSLLRCGEHPRGYPDVAFGRCTGTLRQRGRERLPGKRGRTRTVPQRGKAVSSEVTSGCPKRSEGGSPVGTRTNTAFRAEPCRTWNGTREHERGAASHTGDSASFVRAGSAEKFSLPRRTQPESAHARGRRQPDRG